MNEYISIKEAMSLAKVSVSTIRRALSEAKKNKLNVSIKEGNKVYLREYQRDYIIVNEEIEQKMEAMQMFKKYRTSKTYLDEQIYVHKNEEVKIGYLNI